MDKWDNFWINPSIMYILQDLGLSRMALYTTHVPVSICNRRRGLLQCGSMRVEDIDVNIGN